MFDATDDVVELTTGNFNEKVLSNHTVCFVLFYAPWSGPCRNIASEWKKAAEALRGAVAVGAVDMDVHGSLGGPYNVRSFPTIKIFAGDKHTPIDYDGTPTAQGFVDEAVELVGRTARDRLSGRGGHRINDGGPVPTQSAVVEVTDANFEQEVLNCEEPVLVQFFAPWGGVHCQRLAPEWESAARELAGKVKLTTIDATVSTKTASRYQVQGYPTIKVFRQGSKDGSAEDYQAGRTASDIVAFSLGLYVPEAPELRELVNRQLFIDACTEKPLGMLAFLSADGAHEQKLSMLRALGEKYKQNDWGWVWAEHGRYPQLEQALGVAGPEPALVVVNAHRRVYIRLMGPFTHEGIDMLLKSVAVGRGRVEPFNGDLAALIV